MATLRAFMAPLYKLKSSTEYGTQRALVCHVGGRGDSLASCTTTSPSVWRAWRSMPVDLRRWGHARTTAALVPTSAYDHFWHGALRGRNCQNSTPPLPLQPDTQQPLSGVSQTRICAR